MRNSRSTRRQVLAPSAAFRLYLDEPLERRTLFDLTIDGTSGNDTFIINADSDHVVVSLNGNFTNYPNPSNGNVNILGHSGNDSIWLKTTGTNTFFLTGNDGDDSYHIGDGDLDNQIGAPVHVTELEGPGNGGNDSVLVDDSFGNGTDYNLLDNKLTPQFLTGTFQPIYYEMSFTDSFTLIGSDRDDSLHVFSLHADTTINMQGGDDAVNLSSSAFIPATVGSVSIDAGSGDNLLLMNDYGQLGTPGNPNGNPKTTISDHLIEGFINVYNFNRMLIRPDPSDPGAAGSNIGDIIFTGSFCPAGQVTVMGNANNETVHFGTAASPLTNAQLYCGAVSLDLGTGTDNVSIYDNGTQNWLIQGPTIATDAFSPNVFNMTATGALNCTINAGAGNDTFNLANVPANWNLGLNGGGGNDLYQESNGSATYPNGGRFGDIDLIQQGTVTIGGTGGIDTLTLDDSADHIGDGDEYRITGSAFSKGDLGGAQTQYFSYSGLADLSLVGDSDPNTIRVYNAGTMSSVTVNGGGGSDTFLDLDPSSSTGAFSKLPLAMSIVAGAGSDFAGLDDSQDQLVSEYDVTSSSVSAIVAGTAHAVNYDSTLESLELDQSTGATTTKLLSKIQAMPLTVNCNDGNDSVIAGGGDIDSNGFKANNTTVNGGAGVDSIEFDDHLDTPVASESEAYAMNSSTFGKGLAMLTFNNFESQRVDAADVVPQGQLTTGSEFDINSVSILMTGTTIIGGNIRPSTVILPLPVLNGTLTLTLGSSISDIVTVNDQTISTNKNYTLTSTALTTSTGQTVNYSGVDQFTLNASTGNNNLTLGNGNIDGDLPFATTVNGNAGTDSLLFDNSGDSTLESESLDAGVFTDNRAYPFTGIESLSISEGPGGGTLNLNKVQIPVTVIGRGNSTVNVGAGDLTSNWLASVVFNGAAANDKLVIDDSLTLNGAATYQWDVGDQFHATNVFREPALGSQTITASVVPSRTLKCGPAGDVINVNSTATGLSIFANGGNDQVNVFDSDGPVTVDTGTESVPSLIFPFGDYLNVNTDAATAGDASASVNLLTSDDVYSVTVNSSGASTGTLKVPTFAILNIAHDLNLTGVIDLFNGAIALAGGASQVSQFATWIKNGRGSNTWTGTGGGVGAINSSLAATAPTHVGVGFAPASAVFSSFPATFIGKSVSSNTMLVRYTALGDATISAKTNALDFNTLATNFGAASNKNWYQGDFNYDGFVNTQDFTLLSQNFNVAVAAPPVEAPLPKSMTVARPDLFSTQPISDAARQKDDSLFFE